jgi:hypothetical protein
MSLRAKRHAPAGAYSICPVSVKARGFTFHVSAKKKALKMPETIRSENPVFIP